MIGRALKELATFTASAGAIRGLQVATTPPERMPLGRDAVGN